MDLSALDNEQKPKRPRGQRVKDKTAAPMQITAEQLLAEAAARQEAEIRPPRQRIMDGAELQEFRFRERKKYEDGLRRQRFNPANWTKYAAFEESQQEWDRVRSIFERALETDYQHPIMWIKYAEFEMRHKNVNLARNIWDRAVVLLPRVDQFWYKYAYMEEQIGNYVGARQIYERWMEWKPDEHGWTAFIKFELRHKETERVRALYQRFTQAHPVPKTWIKWAKFEESVRDLVRARQVYESALQFLGEENADEKVFIAFAKFEERAKEVERARAIYKYALDHVPKHLAQELYKMFISFEKQFGDRDAIEEVIVGKRRFQYEEELKQNSRNYDVWFDYARLEEAYGDVERVREVYERAIANVPPAQDKRFWRRYIYLWINYAVFEEMDAKAGYSSEQDPARAREVYKAVIKQIPHKSFSFAKMWLQYAHYEVRQKNLQGARSVFGHAVGLCPKEKIFRAYIDFEASLGEVDRCRKLYEKLLSTIPANCAAWIRFAELEQKLDEKERSRAIFELAIAQPVLDMPEALWKAYIDFEIDQEQHDNVRQLYRRLLERTKHVKVWISAAQFEAMVGLVDAARKIYEEAYQFLRNAPTKEERVMLVESWLQYEQDLVAQQGEGDVGIPMKEQAKLERQVTKDLTQLERVEKLMPRRVTKKRVLKLEDGTDGGIEEYYDYIFPDEQGATGTLKILEMAQKWKKLKKAQDSAAQPVPAAAEAEMRQEEGNQT